MSRLQDVLYRALVSAEEFTENMHRWGRKPEEAKIDMNTFRKIVAADPERNRLYQEFSQLDLELWKKYKMSIFESNVIFMLGKYMTEDVSELNILDVGSGSGMLANALLSLVKTASVQVHYTSIDYKVKPTLESVENVEHEHHSFDALVIDDSELKKALGERKKYDLILIDIEPHGDEIRLYEKFRNFMKEEHICIIPHCFMQTGPYFARPFLKKFIELGHMVDYYAQDYRNDSKDIYMVMKRTVLAEEPKIKCQTLMDGKVVDFIARYSKNIQPFYPHSYPSGSSFPFSSRGSTVRLFRFY
jgi:hypothetical protein